jgi:hypothetical protein
MRARAARTGLELCVPVQGHACRRATRPRRATRTHAGVGPPGRGPRREGLRAGRGWEKMERREERGSSPKGLTNSSNCSPGSNLRQVERWREVEEREREVVARERENEGESGEGRIGEGVGLGHAPRAGSSHATGRAGLRARPTTLYSLSPASNRDQSANRKPKLDECTIRHNITQNIYASARCNNNINLGFVYTRYRH